MDRTIAERVIYGSYEGADISVRVCIDAPTQVGDADWRCSYAFHVGDQPVALKGGKAGGVDSVQALLNALHGVGYVLDRSGIEWSMFSSEQAAAEGVLLHDDGFPRADLNVTFLGAAFRKRMQAHVAGEAEQAMKARSGRA